MPPDEVPSLVELTGADDLLFHIEALIVAGHLVAASQVALKLSRQLADYTTNDRSLED